MGGKGGSGAAAFPRGMIVVFGVRTMVASFTPGR
jgi:hypothetical protein